MRVPQFDKYVGAMRGLGLLLAGMIIGAAVYSSIYHAQFEALISLKSDLEMKLDQYESDIKQWKKLSKQHTVIKSVVPRIEEEAGDKKKPVLDKVTEAELLLRIKKDLSVFIGQSIYEIDSDAQFARKLLSQKIYADVLEKNYTVTINTMLVVDNVLQVWVKVRLYDRPPG
ncbi:hypothetical protein [Paenibacillus radicis (ex Gao et al. 2016)]|uniref:Sporulation membrane protein YtrI C-terminal domain-containing protein n=1 Tax=Paenibacillus radicis (ex Gao et al. 2016) TaxID=1737354 RepID=A0A917M2C8_9BACL|nr:hypothetical protein [Paenibacillus radicis (ex Gao et al. 2016)]GGG74782.1 hypothetical protein GCM10010918_33700 [Paenibacillus radicis (ex Gao et al. 2016)]